MKDESAAVNKEEDAGAVAASQVDRLPPEQQLGGAGALLGHHRPARLLQQCKSALS